MQPQPQPSASAWAGTYLTFIILTVLVLITLDRFVDGWVVALFAFPFGWFWSVVLRTKLRQLGMR